MNNLTLKKSLGQHFLNNAEICKQIANTLNLSTIKNVLEVGPGAGALTKFLLQINNINLMCVEFDTEKVDYLQKHFTSLSNKIIHDDFLIIEKPFEDQFNVIGNFPYNISTQIIFKILDWVEFVPQVVGMFQKEVADRYCSAHGSKLYGVTSVLTQCFYTVQHLLDVEPHNFTPPPKVKSAVIILTRNNNPYQIYNYKKFKTYVKAAFGQRRKTMRNALKSILPAEILSNEIFNLRAEQLSPQQHAQLFKSYYE